MHRICTLCGGDLGGPGKCPGSRVVPPKGPDLQQTHQKGREMREITDETNQVVYAVRLSFDGGQAELDELDTKLRALLTEPFADDPLFKIDRGRFATGGSAPYRSAGFLHGGEMRTDQMPGPAFPLDDDAVIDKAITAAERSGRPPLKMNCTHKGPIHNASCVRSD